MKIICVDNFGRESISDRLIAENVPDYWARIIVELLNSHASGDHDPNYFQAVADNHKLYEFVP